MSGPKTHVSAHALAPVIPQRKTNEVLKSPKEEVWRPRAESRKSNVVVVEIKFGPASSFLFLGT
jgi:hypothetical protein